MLKAIGVKDFSELIAAIPDSVQLKKELKLPPALSELELTRLLAEAASRTWDMHW